MHVRYPAHTFIWQGASRTRLSSRRPLLRSAKRRACLQRLQRPRGSPLSMPSTLSCRRQRRKRRQRPWKLRAAAGAAAGAGRRERGPPRSASRSSGGKSWFSFCKLNSVAHTQHTAKNPRRLLPLAIIRPVSIVPTRLELQGAYDVNQLNEPRAATIAQCRALTSERCNGKRSTLLI